MKLKTYAVQWSEANVKDELKRNIVEFPRHLYPPERAIGIDIRRACIIPANTAVEELLMRFVCPQGSVAKFLTYALYSDALFFNDIEFTPRVNGSRVFPFHGTPVDIPGSNGTQQYFKMALGLGPNLSNANLIGGELTLQPGQVIEWYCKNIATVDTVLGVRMVGYFDPSLGVSSSGFGG
jgi:hypothetical protein